MKKKSDPLPIVPEELLVPIEVDVLSEMKNEDNELEDVKISDPLPIVQKSCWYL